MTNIGKWLNIIISIVIFSLIGYLLFSSEVNNKEAGLISLLLTILSFVVSYFISSYFAEESYKKAIEEVKEQHLENLKVYALNAAEKVGNLSNELNRLSIYLQKELDYNEENLELANHALSERIESTIHIINTLRSVNDTSLSDWRGVIGDELNEQKEEQIERENEIQNLVSRVEDLLEYDQAKQKISDLSEINDIKRELKVVINSISGNVIKSHSNKKPQKEKVSNDCPHCSSKINYRQRKNEKSFKVLGCENCKKRSIARWNEQIGFYLEPEKSLNDNAACPWCNELTTINYSNIPHTTTICECTSCSGKIKIITNVGGFDVHKFSINPSLEPVLTTEILEMVTKKLPPQPWSVGVHKDISLELGLRPRVVSLAIKELIKKGLFYEQIDGVLYEPIVTEEIKSQI